MGRQQWIVTVGLNPPAHGTPARPICYGPFDGKI